MENDDKKNTATSVNILVKKAADAHDSGDAMRFAQAALNAANALTAVKIHLSAT